MEGFLLFGDHQDKFTRRVVGHTGLAKYEAQLVLDALNQARSRAW